MSSATMQTYLPYTVFDAGGGGTGARPWAAAPDIRKVKDAVERLLNRGQG